MAVFSHASKALTAAFLAALSTIALESCGGVRALSPGTPGEAGSVSRYVSPKALQQNQGEQFVEFAATCPNALGQLSHDITGASMWFTIPVGCQKAGTGVGSVEIETGVVSEYALPKGSKPEAIAENAGYVWVADTAISGDSRFMYRFNEDGSYSSFALPSAIEVTSMTAGADGNVWFVGSYSHKAGVGSMTVSGSSTLYQVTGAKTPVLTSIAAGSGGDLWITDRQNGAIVRVSPSSGAMKQYAVGGHPLSITNSRNVLAYSDQSAGQISTITMRGKVSVHRAPPGQRPAAIARKTDGTIVYVDGANNSSAVGNFDPATGKYGVLVAAPNNGLLHLFNGPDGNMWFTDSYGHVGAYLKFILTTIPSSLSIVPQLCSGTFTAAETNYTGEFSVASQNAKVVTVSPTSGSSSTVFEVSEVGPGSTSITVADAMQNLVEVPVLVSGSCGPNSDTYGYTGAPQTFTVPVGVTQVMVQAYGGASPGGTGGYVEATIPVTPGEALGIYVAGNGGYGGQGPGNGGAGGYNGGGGGGIGGSSHTDGGGGGGGASDVRLGGNGLANRVVVSGGAGGGSDTAGGSGGGLTGGSATGCGSYTGGCGGTQTAGGSGGADGYASGGNGALGEGGYGGDGGGFSDPSCLGGDGGGGGGGGYYGGGGGAGGGSCSYAMKSKRGAPDCCSGSGGGGGGGSSYIEPSATNVTNTQGGSTAGQIIISWSPQKASTKNSRQR